MINALIKRVENMKDQRGKPLFASVLPATSILDVTSKPLTSQTVAFVVELDFTPDTNNRQMGPPSQNVTDLVGILVGYRGTGRLTQDSLVLDELNKQVRKYVFGWSPSDDHTPFLLAKSGMYKIQDRQLFWMNRFTTEHLEEACDV